MLASAIINDAGFVNAVLSFFLLGEPFLIVLTIVNFPIKSQSIKKIRAGIISFCLANLIVAYGQYFIFMVLGMHPKSGNPDYIQGVFYHSGGGHVVSASVSLTFGIYYFFTAKALPIWIRATIFLATFVHMLLADAKQVLLAFLVAGVCLLITKLKNLLDALKYIVGAILIFLILLWCIQNVPLFGAFNTWIRPEIYGPEGEATLLKSAAFRIIPNHYESVLNWLFGLGPGHTVGRLGGWIISDYWGMLQPLGATRHSVPGEVWTAVGQSWLGDQSSMFSPLFGWAGIWGDLGLLGLAAYLYLAVIVFQNLCLDDLSKTFLFSVGVFGLIFSQMEEPGYMLTVTIIIASLWQEHFFRRANPMSAKTLHPSTQLNLNRPKAFLRSILLM